MAVILLLQSSIGQAVEKPDGNVPQVMQLIQNRCVKCHGKDGKVKGKVDLLKIDSLDKLSSHPDLIKEMIEVLHAGDMPPEKEPVLPEADRVTIIATLKDVLVTTKNEYAKAEVRRLNRFQYNYAVRDLFQLNRDVFSLPERLIYRDSTYEDVSVGKMPMELSVTSRAYFEIHSMSGVDPFPQDLRAEHGYDNQADSLSMSPLLMESFLSLSGSIINSPEFNPDTCGVWQISLPSPKTKKTWMERSGKGSSSS